MNGDVSSGEGDASTTANSKERRTASWTQPLSDKGQGHGLRILNSLTRQKELFVPINGNQVDWYICGPTVYDSAHAGHARAYVCFDILRRILQDYFGYDVRYVMNVTDIDDKIIARARKRYLFQQYKEKETSDVSKVIENVSEAKELFQQKIVKETNEDKRTLFRNQLNKLEATLKSEGNAESILADGEDILSDWLDLHRGKSVTDHEIFTKLSKHFEAEFHEDMANLGVLPPDVLTRVSEYVPEIVKFIQNIIDKGYGYESEGSVYFDTVKFDKSPEHFYAKLRPEAFGDQNALWEGEGELSVTDTKRNPTDFALWKRSKAGEPMWDSPWGKGRPGWHIECSAMASAICGPKLDIHSGGFDLKFPHHDNEIAQSEAHFGHDQWCNYWIHAGTLRIEGLKMSKSLKNFITIRKALQDYSPRQLRILFLMHHWSDVLDYSTKTLEIAINFEKTTNEFFMTVKHYLRTSFDVRSTSGYQKFGDDELTLDQGLRQAKREVHEALCDNMDTRAAMFALKDLVAKGNAYIKVKDDAGQLPNFILIRQVALYITKMLKVFGAQAGNYDIGFSEAGEEGSVNKEEMLIPYLSAMVEFREQIREEALKNPKEHQKILAACDKVRNETLPDLGVRLEDRQGATTIKLMSAQEIQREKDQKREIAEKKKAELDKRAAEKAAKEAKSRIPPEQLFLNETDDAGKEKRYGKFDEKGIPTHNFHGEELGKKLRKKLEKIHETHSNKYSQLMEAERNNGTA